MINWKDAPESATHWNIVNEVFCDLNGYWDSSTGKYFSCVHLDIGTDKYIARPIEKPVFTQAMCDTDELPSVGMKIIVRHMHAIKPISHRGVVLFISDCRVIIGNCAGEHHFVLSYYRCEPIDTRTDKEIAIDYMKYAYKKGNNMEDVFLEITKGYVQGIKWVGK